MSFESLPDELLLIIFSHLHQIDVFRTFTNLNQRFQRIIVPLASAIDFTYRNMPSYRLYQSFYQDVLPLHGPNIRSLKLAGNQQLYFVQPHLHRLGNLQSLTLIGEKKYDIDKFAIEKQVLIDILSTSSCLSELTIFPAAQNVLNIIASHPSRSLSTLTLLFYNNIPNFALTTPLLFIQRLYINLWSLKAVKQLLRILPNIEQLYLSLLRSKNSTNCHLIEVPPTLTKLHLEMNGFCCSQCGPRFDYIYQFLQAFKNHVHSLDLIFINALREFSINDRFQSLTKDFVRLQSFQYYLRTEHQPDYPHLFSNVEQLQDSTYILYTLPRLQRFDTVSNRTSVFVDIVDNPNQTFMDQYECPLISNYDGEGSLLTPELYEQLKLVNLHEIVIDGIGNIRSSLLELFTKLIINSSSLTDMRICGRTNVCIQILHNVPIRQRKQITYLELMYSYDFDCRESVSALSDMLPNWKVLRLTLRSRGIYQKYFHVATIIKYLRKYCQKLSVLILELWTKREEFKSIFKRIKTELYELSVRTMETQPLCYTAKTIDDDKAFILIWL